MIPSQKKALEGIVFEAQPSRTYHMVLQKSKIVSQCDDLDAIEQAVYKILNTERYNCPIYSWNYGVELKDLFGKPVNYCMAEIERRIREALLQDDRVEKVYGFVFSLPKKKVVYAQFMVDTVKGTIKAEKEVEV